MIFYKPLSHIRAISFDLDDTLYDNLPYIREAERSLKKHIKKHYSEAASIGKKQWREIRQQTLKDHPELAHDLGLLRTTTLTRGFVLAGMRSELVAAAVADCYDHFYYKRSNFEVDSSVHEVLKKLSKRVPLAAITNGNVNCAAIGIERYFSCIVQASPEHPMKPHSAMFEHVAKQLNIPSRNILHVGDDLHKDVEGAINAGYQSAWLAVNRPMSLGNERVSVLPHVQLQSLKNLTKLVKKRKLAT